MTINNKIAHNTIWHFLAKALGLIFGVFTLALVTRYLGQEGFGLYATIFAWLQFFGILIDFGLYIILLSELGKTEDQKEEEKIIGNILSIRLISGFLIMGLAMILVWLMPYSINIKIGTLILSWSFLFSLLNQLFTGVFQKKLMMFKGSLVEVIGKFLGLLFTFIVIYQNWGFYGILITVSLANFINLIIVWSLLKRIIKIKFYFDFDYWIKITKLAWPLAVGTIFNLFYFKADTLILSLYQPATEVGVYSAPYRMLEVLVSLPPIFLGLIMPFLSSSHQKHDYQKLTTYIQQGFNFFAIITIPLVFGTFALAKPIMILVAGSNFAISAPVLKILIVATAFIFFAQLFSYVIIAMEQQKKTLPFIILASFLAVSAYFIFIPTYSYIAAALITLAVETVIMLAFYFFIRYRLKWKPNFMTAGKVLLASIIMYLTIQTLSHLPILLIIFLGIIIYTICIYLLKVIDIKATKSLFKL